MASTISMLPSLEPFLSFVKPAIRCQVDESGSASPRSDDSDYSSNSSSSDSDDDSEHHSDEDEEDSEDESESWTEELEPFPLKPRKPARLSTHIRIGRVSGERRLPYATPLTFDVLVRSPTMFVKKLTQVKKLCAKSLDGRLALLRRPSGFGKTSLLSMVIDVLDVNRREQFSQVFGEFSLLQDNPWLQDDPLLLHLNLNNLPSDLPVFGASLNACVNAALRCFLTRYRDLLRLTHHEINRHMYICRDSSVFSWVMDRVSSLGYSVIVLIDNLNAPLIKSTADNIDGIHSLLDLYLIHPMEASIRLGHIIGGVAVASPLSYEPTWTRMRTAPGYRDDFFDLITIESSQWEVAHRVLGFSKSEISALAAECLPAEDVEPFVDNVIQTLESFDSIYHSPSTYSMSDVLAKLRKRVGQSDLKPRLV